MSEVCIKIHSDILIIFAPKREKKNSLNTHIVTTMSQVAKKKSYFEYKHNMVDESIR